MSQLASTLMKSRNLPKQLSPELIPQIAEESGLMRDVPQDKHRAVLRCLNAQAQVVNENGSFTNSDDSDRLVRFLAWGSMRLERNDAEGNRSILATFDSGALAGRSMTPSFYDSSDVSLVATEPSVVLSFSIVPEVESCNCCIKYLNAIRSTLIGSLTQMNAKLIKNAETLSCRSTREKVMCFLEDQASEQGKSTFEIPYNRQELADYLCVERSALSRELGCMRDDGLITFNRSTFSLIGS